MTSFTDHIQKWGGQADGFLSFSVADSRLLPFSTLLDRGQLDLVEGVYLWQGSPLIYVIDGEHLAARPHDLVQIRRLLAMRGDAGYMGLVFHGQLRVYHLGLDDRRIEEAEVEVATTPQLTLPYLGFSRPVAERSNPDSVTKVVIGLLDDSISALIRQEVSKSDAISLVGRALFTRFLSDRKLLPAGMRERSDTLFDSKSSIVSTCHWLDATFNGDLLPIEPSIIEALTAPSLTALGDIMRRARGGQLSIEWHEAWANLDFSQIPVGVLSQAYESFMQRHEEDRQSDEGGYYTPAPIAEMMVRGALAGVRKAGGASRTKVLDPACGAGIFLIVSFRELVAEHWRASGQRPDTQTLREILYDQITGFDINDSALRFAALALYLISIELDPSPEPVEKLRFENLRGRVLFYVGDHPDKLGSLGDAVGREHDASYDLVVGNPPWPTGSKQKNWRRIQERVNRICRDRWAGVTSDAGIFEPRTAIAADSTSTSENVPEVQQPPKFVASGPALPKRPMDIPFVWRAMEWAKPGAQIAFALHGRLLFQQNEMRQGREALFRSLSVRTVINGAEMRQTDLWPNVAAPFLILFATNLRPEPTDAFKFITPHYEPALNKAGLMRVDLDSAVTVPISQLGSSPSVLKVLARGSSADLAIVERVRKRELVPFASYWNAERVGDPASRHFQLGLTGYGYQALRASSEVTEAKPEPGFSAKYLHGLPMLRSKDFGQLLLDTSKLPAFAEERCHRVKPRELFEGPILLVRKTPPTHRGRIEVGISLDDVLFAETFYGYGAAKDPRAASLLRYLSLLIGSRPIFWLALMTSGEYGVERDVVEKGVIDNLLVPPFEMMSPDQVDQAMALFDLCAADPGAWPAIDAWVADLLGLSARDIQTIEETLDYGLPTSTAKTRGSQAVTMQDIGTFSKSVEVELAPWQRRFGGALHVTPIQSDPRSPWAYLFVGPKSLAGELPTTEIDKLALVADAEAAGEMIVEINSGLVIAKIRQRRVWTLTQSRLLAQRLLWDHLPTLKVTAH